MTQAMEQPAVRKRDSSAAGRIQREADALLAEALAAFDAFGELAELAENLRILSLNAELAAGRAGEKGRAVRALTQYTRELVNRLAQIQSDMGALKSRTNDASATLLEGLREMQAAEENSGHGGQIDGEMSSRIAANLRQMTESVEVLTARTRVVAEVVSQSDSIATNIAIEAAGAGVYEAEFRTVADTMRRYVEQLRTMLEQASHAVRASSERAQSLMAAGFAAGRLRG